MWQDLLRRFCFVLVIYMVETFMGIDWGICIDHRRKCHVDVPSEKKLALTNWKYYRRSRMHKMWFS